MYNVIPWLCVEKDKKQISCSKRPYFVDEVCTKKSVISVWAFVTQPEFEFRKLNSGFWFFWSDKRRNVWSCTCVIVFVCVVDMCLSFCSCHIRHATVNPKSKKILWKLRSKISCTTKLLILQDRKISRPLFIKRLNISGGLVRVTFDSFMCACVCAYKPQHTATHFNTLQYTVTHCEWSEAVVLTRYVRIDMLMGSTHCNTLQHTATHCNTLQHTATHCNTLQHKATLCYTLQNNATQCNTCAIVKSSQDKAK